MHKALHTKDDIGRLYISRKERERGLASIDDCVDVIIQKLENYAKRLRKDLRKLLIVCDRSCLFHLPRQYTGSLSLTAKQQMHNNNHAEITQFWLAEICMLQTPSHQRQDA